MPLEFWLDFVVRFGLPFALISFFVYALHKGWVVMGKTHDRIVRMLEEALSKQELRGDKWESRAQGLLERAASTAQAAERAVAHVTSEAARTGRQRRQE